MSWLSRTFRNIMSSDTPPTQVVVADFERYTHRPVRDRGEGIVLYGPTKSEQNWEIVLMKSFADSRHIAYSIYKNTDEEESIATFAHVKEKLPIFVKYLDEASTVPGLQRIWNVLYEYHSWTIAHSAVQLNILDLFAHLEFQRCIDMPDTFGGMRPFHLAVKNINVPAIRLFMNNVNVTLDAMDNEGDTVLHYAAETNKEIIALIVDKVAHILNHRNAFGYTPLHKACLADKPDCVKALLMAGADANISATPTDQVTRSTVAGDLAKVVKDHDSNLHKEDMKFGGTPLHWACSTEVIEQLITSGCDINALNFDGKTALQLMVMRERLGCTVKLLSYGCDPDAIDVEGNTALHYAAKNVNIPMIQALIVFGAALDAKNNELKTARHIVASKLKDEKARKALYILHAAGASRCSEHQPLLPPSQSLQCTEGCSMNGIENGLPPPSPITWPSRAVQSLYDCQLTTETSKGGRVLCLDGGGIRGLVLIHILQHLEVATGAPIVSTFDWFAGTSTGGILALALASGKNLKECLCLYFRMKDKTFLGSRPYESEPLETILKEVFGNSVMTDISHPKVMITGLLADFKPANLHLFRNYAAPSDLLCPSAHKSPFKPITPPHEQEIWKVARASGAAPSYFRMFERYLDGGLVANNPTMDALTEIHEYHLAMKHLQREGEPACYKPTVVVSVGTGTIPVSEVPAIDVFRPDTLKGGIQLFRGMSALGTLLVDQATQADGRVVDRARAWCHMLGVPYFRFSHQMSEEISMDEKDDQKLLNMLWEAKVYMMSQQEEIFKLAHILNQ